MNMMLFVAAAALSQGAGADFDTHWHDGRAEIDGYRLAVTRYGQQRSGEAVMIFVTEPFSEDKRVKVDDPDRDPSDTFDALKLNLVRDFQTGIYDYNTMTSVFARSADFEPVKVSFSSAEWCGHVYEELIFERRDIREQYFSYFEGESSSRKLPRKAGGIAEDNLYILLRGLRGPYLEPGAAVEVPFLPSSFHRRLRHRPLAWTTARLERRAAPEAVEVPAGVFEAAVYDVSVEGGRRGRFDIEQAHPHRIVRWEWSGGGDADESGELAGTTRVAYWQLNSEGDERRLEPLGLSPVRP